MTKHDAAVTKALAELGLAEEPKLSPEQALMLARALDPEKDFIHSVEKLFTRDPLKK